MWNSVTLKRSLLQISKAKPSSVVGTGIGNRFNGRSFSQQQPTLEWEGSTETCPASSSSNNNNNVDDSSNGIIRFTMTPKPQHAPTFREYGTKPMDGETSMMDAIGYDDDGDEHEQFAAASLHNDGEYDHPFADRMTAAEQMANLMENSYYYASFQAEGSK